MVNLDKMEKQELEQKARKVREDIIDEVYCAKSVSYLENFIEFFSDRIMAISCYQDFKIISRNGKV